MRLGRRESAPIATIIKVDNGFVVEAEYYEKLPDEILEAERKAEEEDSRGRYRNLRRRRRLDPHDDFQRMRKSLVFEKLEDALEAAQGILSKPGWQGGEE